MNIRRAWVCVFLFTLTLINYTDRVALSVAAKPISSEFHLSPVAMGYLLSSFLWTYILCLIPVGFLVDRFGGKGVNAGGIALWSLATVFTGLSTGFWFMVVTRMTMAWANRRAGRHPTASFVNGFRQPNAVWRTANAIFGAGGAAGPALGSVVVTAIVSSLVPRNTVDRGAS